MTIMMNEEEDIEMDSMSRTKSDSQAYTMLKPNKELRSIDNDDYDDTIIDDDDDDSIAKLLGEDDDATQQNNNNNNATTITTTTTTNDSNEFGISNFLERIFFPPEDHHEIQILRMENLAVPACYLTIGLGQGLLYPLMNVYPIDLGATEAQQSTIFSIRALPSCFKIFFGFISDNFPLFGYRRKSHMLLGWFVAILSLLILVFTSDLTLKRLHNEKADQNTTETTITTTTVTTTIAPTNAPSIPLLGTTFFLWSMGIWFADVMADSLVAEKCRHESSINKGNLQTTCYLCRAIGFIIGTPLSTVLYSIIGPWIIIYSAIVTPLFIMVPLIHRLSERRMDRPDLTTAEQFNELWRTVCNKAVWQPMGFVYFYMLLMVPNAAWREYLKSVLGFTSSQLNILLLIAVLLMFVGVLAFKFILIRWSWRNIFWLGCCINAFFSALQILLIQGQTFGLSPFVFALGDDAVKDFIAGTQFLPIIIMMVNLCPTGVEGASYAMFTTVFNAASALNDAISTLLLRIWDVRKETMIQGDLSGLTKLACLTTGIQLLPLFFMFLMPKSLEELKRMRDENENGSDDYYYGSRLGGFIFVIITTFSVSYAVFIGFMNVFVPGWNGES